ncbi:hypothetical protein ACLB2K_011390 [Fragaria x ananassa]
MDILDATIKSLDFYSPIQEESLIVPAVDQLLSDYAKRFNKIKLWWKKNLGTAKLELQFEDRERQFMGAPLHAAIVKHGNKLNKDNVKCVMLAMWSSLLDLQFKFFGSATNKIRYTGLESFALII